MKKPLRPLILLLAAMLACNLPVGGQAGGEAPATPAATPATAQPAPLPTPTALAPAPTAEPTQTAAPAGPSADLVGQARPANAPGEWPLYNSGNTVEALLAQGDVLWAGTTGGIVRWDTAADQYQRFTAADGQPLSTIYDLATDSSGQIWAAGQEGLAVYDGAAWQHISQSDMGLPDTPLRAVAVDAQGDVWAGGDEYYDYSKDPFYVPQADETQGGLARLHDGAWQVYDVVNDALLSNQINDLAVAPDGSLWVALGQAGSEPTPGGVMQYNPDGSWQSYTSGDGLDGFAFSNLAFTPDGALWIGGRRGVNRMAADNVQSYELPNVRALAAAPDGTLWIGTYDGLHQYSQSALTPVNISDLSVNALAVTAPGDLWIGTDLSLARLDGESLERHYTTDGPLSNIGHKLAFASDGSLWVDTRHGISRLVGDQWEHYLDPRTAVEAAYPWESSRHGLWPVDSEGGIWLTEGDGLARYDGANWVDVTPPQGPVYVLAPDPNGGMWAASESSLIRFLGGAWQPVAPLDKSGGTYGLADMLVDTQGHVWVSIAIPYVDGGNVARWDGDSWTVFTEDDGMAGNATSDLTLGPDGQIWAAHDVRGLSRFDGQTWHVEVSDPRALGLDADGFASITFAPDGSMWARLESHCGFEGTCFTGIAHQVGGQWTAYHAGPGGPPTDTVFDLAVSDDGQVWLGTAVGVVKLVP